MNKILSLHLTETGPVRSLNADAVFADDKLQFWAVADGVGSAPSSAAASLAAVKLAAKNYRTMKRAGATVDPAALFEKVRREYDASFSSSRPPATTLTFAYRVGDQLTYASVGDSPAFMLRDRPRLLTRDHTIVDREREITDYSAMKTANGSNIIYNFLGSPDISPKIYDVIELLPGDRIVICTDGLLEILSQSELYAVSSASATLSDLFSSINRTAMKSHPPDNYSLIGLEVRQ